MLPARRPVDFGRGEMAMLARARGVASRIERFTDRALHPHRRRAALRRLERRSLPSTILFVCLGNICRSPFAAESLRQRLSGPLRHCVAIESAGFVGPGRPPPSTAIEVAASMGIDLSPHRSRLVDPRLLRASDLIFVMDPVQRRMLGDVAAVENRIFVLGDLDPGPADSRVILDPIGQPAEVFQRVYRRIDACVAELARILHRLAGM